MLAQRLLQLDRSSAGFPEQLDKLLHDQKWVEQVQLLPRDKLVKVIECMNDVRLGSTPNQSHSSPR